MLMPPVGAETGIGPVRPTAADPPALDFGAGGIVAWGGAGLEKTKFGV